MIQIQNLRKTFGSTVAINNITFDVKDNEILGFLGPNAAGKTTTMRIITGFLSPDSGNVFIDNKNVCDYAHEIKSMIGYLPENNPLYEDLSVYEYLQFIGMCRQVKNLKNRLSEIIETCKIKEVMNRNISELSKGFRQRVGFASAILHEPKILVLDEPTAGLDPNQAYEVRELIKSFKKDKTVILSTHILSEVEQVADRVVIIHKGSIVAQGNIEELHSMILKKNIIYLEGRFNKDIPEYLPTVVEGIQNVRLIKEDSSGIKEYEIETTNDVDIREKLFNLAVAEKWVITGLYRSSVSLQDIFIELTKE